jgi:ectoine hydroxylase-related dioxygenase (phytanoyl-CoA dioxygenase family)
MADISGDIQQRGFTLVPKLVSPLETAHLKVFFDDAKMARTERGGDTYGARNLLALNEIKQISASSQIATYLAPLLGSKFQAVRGIFFDKTENANWPVLWHQDLSLAVKARHDISGWAGWSVKRGIPHVQAPAAILEKMVTIRVHLDNCPAENGALRVIAGSHAQGRLSRETIQTITASQKADVIAAEAGDVLLMRPLILHASSPALSPTHRRVLHLEFAPFGLLPEPLAWAEAA